MEICTHELSCASCKTELKNVKTKSTVFMGHFFLISIFLIFLMQLVEVGLFCILVNALPRYSYIPMSVGMQIKKKKRFYFVLKKSILLKENFTIKQ